MHSGAPLIAITGGAGFIGSHTCCEFLKAKWRVLIIDDLSNSKIEVLDSISHLIFDQPYPSPEATEWIYFEKVDITIPGALDAIFAKYSGDIRGVVHLAGLKAISVSTKDPLLFYSHNVVGAINLFQSMERNGITNIIFSSSASVYGNQKQKLSETAQTRPLNPYGTTKLMVEEMLRSINQFKKWSVIILRYFNPLGCDPTGRIGEDPVDTEHANLQTIIAELADGKRKQLSIYGNRFDTRDGTAIRDYVHVVDVARGHLVAATKFGTGDCFVYNLGLGEGYTVLEILKTWETVLGRSLPHQVVDAREGEPDSLTADISLVQSELNWNAEFKLEQMVRDFWNFWKLHKSTNNNHPM